MTMDEQQRKSSLVRQPNMVENSSLYNLFKTAGANVDAENQYGFNRNRARGDNSCGFTTSAGGRF